MDEFEINVAYAGQHWSRVTLPVSTVEADARSKARVLCAALNAHMISTGSQPKFEVSLTRWNRVGHGVEIV